MAAGPVSRLGSFEPGDKTGLRLSPHLAPSTTLPRLRRTRWSKVVLRPHGGLSARRPLADIGLKQHEWNQYERIFAEVSPAISQLRALFERMKSRQRERTWMRRQCSGELDDSMLGNSTITTSATPMYLSCIISICLCVSVYLSIYLSPELYCR